MRPTARSVLIALFAGISSAVLAGGASAQSAGCSIEQIGGTSRNLIQCRGGLSITVEKDARYELLDRNRNGRVDGVRLRNKALLIDLPKSPKEGFEVIAPQAIAAVRGTRWAVDVGAGKTSVFVVDGEVGVRRRSGSSRVTLGPGDGVDVETGSGPLTVKHWPKKRVTALMARFGE